MPFRLRSLHKISLAASVVLVGPALASAQSVPAGWTPVWSDEFDAASVDTARWDVLNRRDSYNNEKQYYTPGQVSVSNGTLKLTASNVPLDGKAYRSGLVRTNAEQTYGRWEVRASLPAGQGMWPAIWLLPRTADWPTGGEIDIMENRGSEPNSVGHAYHYGSSVATHQYVNASFGYAAGGKPVSFQNAMHTYAVEWDAGRVRYLVDDIPSYTFYNGNAPVSSTPMSLILNLAVGGDYGGDPNAATAFPQAMSVDSVRVYRRNTATSALTNTSFEQKADSLFAGWNEYGAGFNVIPDATAANAHTGTTAAQIFGRFDGTADNASGLYQELPTTAGEIWQVGAFARNRPGDVLAGQNTGRYKLEFIDANGNVIGSKLLTAVDANSPQQYREAVLRAAAPNGAKFVRAVLEVRQINQAGGAMNVDDATLRRATAASTSGDINLDGVANASDIDALSHSLAADNALFDFNGSGTTTAADVDSLLASAFGTYRGDFDLNHVVDFNDFLVLQNHFGEKGAGYAFGDATGDSKVDFNDFLALQNNFGLGTTSPAAYRSEYASVLADAAATLPEPGGMLAGLGVLGMVLGRVRRRAV